MMRLLLLSMCFVKNCKYSVTETEIGESHSVFASCVDCLLIVDLLKLECGNMNE